MLTSDLPPAYYGKILTGNCSEDLRKTVIEQIAVCTSFDQLGLSVMPYISAWRTDRTGIWYEFVSAQFLELFHCGPESIVQKFSDSIIDHRKYQQTDIYPDIKESILDKDDLDNQRTQLRVKTVNEGVVEAIYKVQADNNHYLWLKDWASITLFKEDRTCLSPGYLCNVSLEMSQKDHLDEINVTVNRDKKLLVEAERSAALGQISAKIYHEIRNPILSIGALAKRLLNKQEVENSLSFLQVIAKEANRLENILDNLFHYTRTIKIITHPCDLAALTKESIDLLKTDFDRQHIQLALTCDGDIPLTMIDKEQIQLALVHLLKNSIEAMPTGGSLSITIRSLKDCVIISIDDSGEGILDGHTSKVTEPFFTTKVYGTGLGLSLAQKAIELHGGSLTFESSETGGTLVKVQLPLS